MCFIKYTKTNLLEEMTYILLIDWLEKRGLNHVNLLVFLSYYCMYVIGQADTGREWDGIYNVCSGGQRCCC
jgi:hypothetical protein